MRLPSNFRSILLACGTALALAACTQGEDIASPGPSNPGTPPNPGPGGPGPGPGGPTAQCPTGFTEGAAVAGLTTCDLSDTILSDLTLPFVEGVAYRLDGRVNIGTDTGADNSGGNPATLTIEPGVTVFGSSGADYLVVNRGSRLVADGDADNPIIFTSEDDLERQTDSDPSNDDGGSNISEWGGLVILGRAPINRCIGGATPGAVDCEQIIEGVTNPEAVYGGATSDDDSGVLRYIQVRFAGFAINQQGNELNGISFGGVGSDTVVEYVQVHNNSDDGVEFFGGAVNVKYLVLTGNDDDSLDTDNGWDGNIQYMVIRQRDDGGDNAMEMSSTGAGNIPATNPAVANFTVVGNRSNAWRLNSGHIGAFYNGVVDYGAECFRWQDTAGDGDNTFSAATDPSFNSVLFDCDGGLALAGDNTVVPPLAVAAGANNVIGASSLTSDLQPGMAETAVTAFDLNSLPGARGAFFDGFSDGVDYIGAFDPDNETATNNWATGWTFALFPDPACPAGTNLTGEIDGVNVCSLAGVLTSDLTLTRGNHYELEGRFEIGVDIGADGTAANGDAAVLRIEPGVTIFGNAGSDFLVVNRGSQIFSTGTRQNPIVFTSEADLRGAQTDPANAIGEWGGLVLLGRAPINRCIGGATPGTAACEQIIEGVTNPEAIYGGAVSDDNSGVLRFTQVKFAGFAINQQGNELNGISYGGVGDGTIVEYVQVHNNSDDGMEFFGGTVNAKHIILTGNDDDSLDTDNGWDGAMQFLIITQRATGGDNAMEMSSTGAGNPLSTNPTVANFTVVGARSNAWRLNSGHIGRFINGVVSYGSECFRWQDSAGDGDNTFSAATDPSFNSVLFDCDGGLALVGDNTVVPPLAVAADANNTTNVADTLINGFINGPAESSAQAFATPLSSIDPFFEDTSYIGAVEDANDRWWADWSCGLEASTPC